MDIRNNSTQFTEGAPYIYVSFSSNDAEKARGIINELRWRGFNIYFEVNVDIDNVEKIDTMISGCEAVIIILSDDSAGDVDMQAEKRMADYHGKRIYLLQTEKSSASANLTLSLPTNYYTSIDVLVSYLPDEARIDFDGYYACEPDIDENDMYSAGCDMNFDAGMAVPAAPMPDPAGIPIPAPAPMPTPMPAPAGAPMPPSPSFGSHHKSERPVKVKPQPMNKVDFSVLSPEKVKPGASALIDVFMYTKKQRRIVDEIIKRSKDKITEAARSASSVSVRQGSAVTVVLSSEDAVIADSYETLYWNGDALDFKFRFSLPDDYRKKQVDFTCSILFDGIHISRLYFSVSVNTAKSAPIKVVRKDTRDAFVSYCHSDKQRVLDQIYAIQSVAPRMKFWMDTQSLNAGDNWRNEIASAIRSSDVFLLFWSINAKTSSEVRKEWEYALQLEKTKKKGKKGERFISPVPLDPPSLCTPPEELGDLHFGSPSFDEHYEHIDGINFINEKKVRNIRRIK